MLCSRSASLTRMTRTSRAMASSILRKVSAWAVSRLPNSILSSLDRPSTMSATTRPNCWVSSVWVTAVSSRVSCSRAAHRASPSSCQLAQISAPRWVGDVGFTGGALLSAVGLLGHLKGVADALQVGVGQVEARLGQQRVDGDALGPVGFFGRAGQVRARGEGGDDRGGTGLSGRVGACTCTCTCTCASARFCVSADFCAAVCAGAFLCASA